MVLNILQSGFGKKIKFICAAFIISFLYLLIFSAYSSPLFPGFYQYDSAIFMMVGKAIVSGKQLYIDVFDHKGPILFWINALGMWMGGRNGVFLLQCLFMTVNLILMNRITELFDAGRYRIWVFAITMIYLAYPLANGNLSEEYSLPFIFLSLYLFLKDLQKGENPTVRYSVIYGICMGVLLFIRANNAVTICGIVLFWVLELCYEKKIMVLLQNIIAGIAGIAAVTLPVCIYFAAKGSLQEMFFATFQFNMKYSSRTNFLATFTQKSVLVHMVILFAPLIMAAFVFIHNDFSMRFRLAIELILLLNFLSMFLGFGYNHYFMIEMPIVQIMVILELKILQYKRTGRKPDRICRSARTTAVSIVLAVYLVLFIRIICVNVRDYYISGAVTKEYATVQEMCKEIPDEEKNSVLGYEIPARYYLIGNILPCYKYGILQSFWSEVDPEIMQEYVAYLENQSPKWLLVQAGASQEGVDAVLVQKYELVSTNEFCSLYQLK